MSDGISEFTKCWTDAVACFRDVDQPQWKRVTNGMMCFKGLPLDQLPPKLGRRLDSSFLKINKVLARYDLKTWEDYQKISSVDLDRLEAIIRNLA